MAEPKADEGARGKAADTGQSSETSGTEVMRHAQDMTNDVLHHVPKAAGELARHAQDLSGEIARHAQDLSGEVAEHSRTAAGDVRRETPILLEHLKENILGWFRPKERGGHGNHPHR